MLIFDGNAIGQLFNKPFEKWRAPHPNGEEISTIWEKNKQEIMDLGDIWDDEALRNENSELTRHFEHLYIRRMQPLIRKQRRSFLFNANWWLSLHAAIKKNPEVSMVPWIMAGDDLVMVNHLMVDSEDIRNMLKEFQHNLDKAYPSGDVNITFAGSLQLRGNDSIIEMYNKARKLEEMAAFYWKWHANQKYMMNLGERGPKSSDQLEWTLLHRTKVEKLQQWLKANPKNKSEANITIEKLEKENYAYLAADGYLSLIIPSDLDVK